MEGLNSTYVATSVTIGGLVSDLGQDDDGGGGCGGGGGGGV